MKKSNWKTWLRRFVMLICLVVFCYSAVQLGISFWASAQQKQIKEKIELIVDLPDKVEEAKEFKVDFEKLKQENPDIVGYILIPKTNISYPILYRKGDTEFYLRRDLHGNYSPPGSIFMDGEASPEFKDRHTFIYGHNQKDRTMFGDIREFLDKQYFDERDVVYLFTPEKNYRLDIIAVETSKVDGQAYETVGLDTDEEMHTYIQNLRKNAKYFRQLDLKDTDSIISLSTCGYYDIHGTRDLLHLKVTEWK